MNRLFHAEITQKMQKKIDIPVELSLYFYGFVQFFPRLRAKKDYTKILLHCRYRGFIHKIRYTKRTIAFA